MRPLGRPTGEMPTPHATHDLELLAAVADRETDAATQVAVERMVAACAECAAIAADLRAIAMSLTDLPTSIPAPRDMRLTPTRAASLRRGAWWRALLRPFGVDGLPALRPLAGAMTAIGLVGLLLTTVPLPLGSSAAPALAPAAGGGSYSENGGAAGRGGPSPADVDVPQPASFAPEQNGTKGDGVGATPHAVPPNGSAAPVDQAVTPSTVAPAPDAFGGTRGPLGGGPSIPPLTLVSLVLLAVGAGLLTLQFVARRVA